MAYRLGIDTGGTYTDAVLIDENHQVQASCKSLTTRQDLSIGIAKAMSGLPAPMLDDIELVSLSTTLTTNSVVEQRGADVCVLLAGYSDLQLEKSKLLALVPKGAVVTLAGGHDANGEEKQPLDEARARLHILKYQGSVASFAISSMFATRNPAHELKLQALVAEICDKPVACAHDLASSLGAPQRALTAVLNARMIPYIGQLVASVEAILKQRNITAPLMIVKGDGSLINTKTALKQPVATVLSGPAASVIGACALSGLKNAIVVDMGGTTTDIAIVSNGRPTLSAQGAQVGDWQPMVEAIKVFCVGLGGDSEVQIKGAQGLSIGPRRVVPISLLAEQYPWVITRLEQQLAAYPTPRHNKFVLPLESNEQVLAQLSASQLAVWEKLQLGPIELEQIGESNRNEARTLAKLQRLGLAIYSGFTPTDAAHVLGKSTHLNTQAAVLAAKIWSNQMRCLYGVGRWQSDDALGPSQQVFDLVIEKINQCIIEASLNQLGKLSMARTQQLTKLLSSLIVAEPSTADDREHNTQNSALFNIGFAAKYPIVAVGAPALSYYPAVSEKLGVKVHLPKHGEVASAVGAVMGSVVQRASVTISQPSVAIYKLYHGGQPLQYNNLLKAKEKAEEIVSQEARARAVAAGAINIEIAVTEVSNHVKHPIDGELFIDCEVIATATGRPCYQH
ncbi:MAG: hydantoinase/oxoprolinase family protein [Oceanospirillaceae bacterium]|nr:hydantoinase/oxoprolinase family protein [Oceanospirillaceae bacterium]